MKVLHFTKENAGSANSLAIGRFATWLFEFGRQRYGIANGFDLIVALNTQHNIEYHAERRRFGFNDGSALNEAIWLYAFEWYRMAPEEAVCQIARTLAHEMQHIADYEQFPKWVWQLASTDFHTQSILKVAKEMPRWLQSMLSWFGKLAYKADFFEIRARKAEKRFAKEIEVFLRPLVDEIVHEYEQVSQTERYK